MIKFLGRISQTVFFLLSCSGVASAIDVAIPGAMAGGGLVAPTGVMQYELPLTLPRSRGGFGPALAVKYNSGSQDSTGLMGIGWGLSGLESITRCPQTVAQDNQIKAVNFTGTDRFCLNGQRLIAVSGAYGLAGTEYRTEIDSFTKVVSYGVQDNGPAYFKAWTKDGLVKEFGNTGDSKLFVNLGANAQTDPETYTSSAPLGTKIQSWGLNKVTDRSANYWIVAYDSASSGSGVLYPVGLNYTGHAGLAPNNRVEIVYEERTMFDKGYQYQVGSLVSQSQRIKTIKVFADTLQAMEYRFEYQGTETAALANHSRLSSIEECHLDKVMVAYCLDKTHITWSSAEALMALPGLSTYQDQPPVPVLSPQTHEELDLSDRGSGNYITRTADISGDGRSDIILLGYKEGVLQVRTLLAKTGVTNAGFMAVQSQEITDASFLPYTVPEYVIGDVNRDGKADLVVAFAGNVFTYLATGSGVFASSPVINAFSPPSAPASAYRFMLADINGDGVTDFAGIRGVASCDGHFTCGGVFRSASGEVLVMLRGADGTVGPLQSSLLDLSSWPNSNIQDMAIADIDGDGFPDAVLTSQIASSILTSLPVQYGNDYGYKASGDYGVFVAKGNGTGSFSATTASVAVSAASLNLAEKKCDDTFQDVTRYWAGIMDLNRDGLVDILLDQVTGCLINQGSSQVRMYQPISTAISRGDGTFAIRGGRAWAWAGTLLDVSLYAGWRPVYLDIDGNGAMDVMRINIDAAGAVWGLLTVGVGTGDFSDETVSFQISSPLTTFADGWLSPVVMSGDTNADGMAEIVVPIINDRGEVDNTEATAQLDDTSYISVVVMGARDEVDPAALKMQNQVSQIQRGQIVDEFSYAALPLDMAETDPLYVMDDDAEYPQIDLNMPIIVVSQARNKLNDVLQKTTDYRYEGAKADLKGRGFLGFRKSRSITTRDATLPGGSTETLTEEQETTFRQDFPYTGQPVLMARKANGVLVMRSESDVSTDFVVTNPYPGVYFPRTISTLQSTYDPGTGNLLSTTRQELDHNAYGDVRTETVTTRNAAENESFITSSLNTYYPGVESSWKIGLLETRQVTAQRTGRPSIVRESFRDYDANGLLKQEVVEPNAPDLRVQTDYLRDDYGNVTFATTSGAGDAAHPETAITTRTTEMRYESGTGYPAGVFKTKDINPLAHAVSYTFDPFTGAVLTATDANGRITTVVPDALGRETSRSNPDGTQSTTGREMCSSFDAVGDGTTGCEAGDYLKVTMTKTGFEPEYVFLDGAGREVRKVSRAFDVTNQYGTLRSDGPNFIITRTEYDEAGRVKRSSKPAFDTVAYGLLQWTSNKYDSVGRLISQTQPGGRITTSVYNGLATTTTNPKNQTRTEVRNAAGEVVQIQDANGQLLTYELDALGRISKTIDPKNNQVVFTLDKLGRKKRQEDPDLGIWDYRYDVLGQLVWQKDAQSPAQVSWFTYDKLGRPLTRSEVGLNSVWTWDTAANGIGQLAKLTGDNNFERTYSYNASGYLIKTTTKKTIDPYAPVGAPDFEHTIGYDTAGRPQTVTYPSGFGYKNVYDGAGYLVEVRNKASSATCQDTPAACYWRPLSRDAEGHVTREILGNGLVTDRTYKADSGYIDTVQAGTLAAGTLTASVQNDAYSFDDVGNLSMRSQYFGSTSLTETFGYDSLNRLTTATVLGGLPKTATYDEIGNITHRSDVGDYVYTGCGGAHRVCYVGFAGKSIYDGNGNLTSGNGRAVTWTSYNYPMQITKGTSTESFEYSPERERVRRTSVEGGQTTTTVYLNPRIDLGNTFEKTYLPDNSVEYAHYVYAGGQVVGSAVALGAGAAEMRYFHTDHQGSIMAVSNAAGGVAERLSYDAWGKRRYPASNDDTCNVLDGESTGHGYTQHEHLDSVDLVHMNGRVYDPLIGRFISADPNVFYPDNLQDFNRYSYAHNNPLSFTDPSGFSAQNGINLDFNNFSLLNPRWLPNAFTPSSINLSSLINPIAGFNWFGANSQAIGLSQSPRLSNGFSGGSLGTISLILPSNSAPYVSDVPSVPSARDLTSSSDRQKSIFSQIYNALPSLSDVWDGFMSLPPVMGPGEVKLGMALTSKFGSVLSGFSGALRQGDLGSDIANTFRGGRYEKMLLDEPMILGRYYDNEFAFAKGRFMADPLSFTGSIFLDRMGLALRPSWNAMTKRAYWELPAGTTIYRGTAAAQFPWFGGRTQYFVPDLSGIRRVMEP